MYMQILLKIKCFCSPITYNFAITHNHFGALITFLLKITYFKITIKSFENLFSVIATICLKNSPYFKIKSIHFIQTYQADDGTFIVTYDNNDLYDDGKTPQDNSVHKFGKKKVE